MTTINAKIQDFKNGRLSQSGKKWDLYVINPYNLAYQKAYDKFQDTFEEQANKNKMMLDLMLTGLSIFGGTVFTAVFGDTTSKALAGRIAVNQVNKSNSVRVLKMAGFMDNNITAQFVLGELWSQSSSVISNKAKSLFEPNPKNFPATNAIVQKPYEIEYALKQFKLNCEVKLFEVLDELMRSNLDASRKEMLLARAKNSHFCNPPDTNEYPRNLAEKIELSFWMKYILATDYQVDFSKSARPISIEVLPSSKAYPKRNTPLLAYAEVGQHIIDRINKLYKREYSRRFIDSDYFGERTSFAILKKAEATLNHLAMSTPKIKRLPSIPRMQQLSGNCAAKAA